MPSHILLLSIRPEYAKKIMAGEKTVELRRVRTRLESGDLVMIYVSSPEKALVGLFEVETVIVFDNLQKHLKKFWNHVQERAGIEYTQFYKYYKGASVGVGIFIKNLHLFSQPIELERLREELPNLKPPQSYRYITDNELKIVIALGETNIS